MTLAHAVVEYPESNGVRVGRVSQLLPDLLVDLNGGEVRSPGVLSSYPVRVGDVVAMLRQGNTWLVLGAISGTAGGPAVSDVQLLTANISNTVYSPTSGGHNTCGVVFVAPFSGQVMVHWVAEMATSTSFMLVSWGLRTGDVLGSGTAVLNPSDDRTVRHGATTVDRIGVSHLLTDLTPGDPYNLSLEHRVAAAVASSLGRREVQVVPVS